MGLEQEQRKQPRQFYKVGPLTKMSIHQTKDDQENEKRMIAFMEMRMILMVNENARREEPGIGRVTQMEKKG